jgi:hypothetical protein
MKCGVRFFNSKANENATHLRVPAFSGGAPDLKTDRKTPLRFQIKIHYLCKPKITDHHHLTYCEINTGSQFQSETAPGVSRSFIIRPTGFSKVSNE